MRSRIALKLYWLIGLSVFVSILISSVAIVMYLLNQYEKEVQNKDELHIKGLSGNVKGFIDRAFTLNYQLSLNPIVIDNIARSKTVWEERKSTYQHRYKKDLGLNKNSGLEILVKMHKEYDFVELFFAQDKKGDQTARSFGKIGHRGNRWWFKKIIHDKNYKPFFSKSYYSLTGQKPVSSAFHPVYKNGAFVGILGMDINFDFLQDFVSRHLYSKDLFAMITDNQGVIIAHPDKNKMRELINLKKMTRKTVQQHLTNDAVVDASGHMKTDDFELNWTPKISQMVKEALAGKSGYMKDVELEGKNCTLYYRPVPLPGNDKENFVIILVRDNSTLLKTKITIFVYVLIFTFLTMFVFIFLFHWYFKQIILVPMKKLTGFIGTVDLESPKTIELNTGDEFQILAETFNTMHGNLKSAKDNLVELNEELEEKVEKRTAELQKSNLKLNSEIQEHKITTKELVFAKNAAESANIAKSQFLANISHELRTPMHGILGFARLGYDKIKTINRDTLENYFEEILSAGDRLLGLLNNLLDLARLESGAEMYKFQKNRLADAVIRVISEISAVLEKKNIEILFEKPAFDDEAEFDKDKVIRVIENLASNSIRFSEAGSTIKIEMNEEDAFLGVAVIDSGIGVPENELESVFDKFVQSSKTRDKSGGTGLGLSISREIIQKHSGEIWAENNPEKGATFQFKIPKRHS